MTGPQCDRGARRAAPLALGQTEEKRKEEEMDVMCANLISFTQTATSTGSGGLIQEG